MRGLLAAGIAVALLPAAGAAASPARDTLIRPGKGIGRVDLGMTPPRVRRALGRPDVGYGEARSRGRRYVEWVWDRGPRDFYSVGFLGRPGSLRAVTISTTRPRETLSGIGPGSRVSAMKRRLRGLRCHEVFPAGGGTITQTEYVLGSRNGPQTVFVPGKWQFYERDTSTRIAYVVVRLPESLEPAQRVPCPQ